MDTDEDPYSVKHGFWHAHIGWMFKPRVSTSPSDVPDLAKNHLVLFQEKYYAVLILATNVLVAGLAGILTGDFLGAFLIVWMLRQVATFHTTWFVNSIAHTFGSRGYAKELSAVDNYFISLLTFGEGYHNYHHAFEADYRNGIKWYHYDPGKWLIWAFDRAGWVTYKNEVQHVVVIKRLVRSDKSLLEQQLVSFSTYKQEYFQKRIDKLSDSLTQTLKTLQEVKAISKTRYKNQKRLLREELKLWNALTKQITQNRLPM
jgi:stearoyl-CoA desaturase (delta-9 desaturase)